MKKINSIYYGSMVIILGLIIGIGFPIMLKWITGKVYMAFVYIGAALLIGIVVLLFIELFQEKKIYEYYDNHKNARIFIRQDFFECANCGNRRLNNDDKCCTVCGTEFKETLYLSPDEILRKRKTKIK